MHRAIRAKYRKTVTLIIILDHVKKTQKKTKKNLSRYSTIRYILCDNTLPNKLYRIRTILSPFYLIYISIYVAISRILNS